MPTFKQTLGQLLGRRGRTAISRALEGKHARGSPDGPGAIEPHAPRHRCISDAGPHSPARRTTIPAIEPSSSAGGECLEKPAPRVALGCVAENNPKFMAQAVRWVQSIRWFAGHWAPADVFVCVVDRADAAARYELERYGAKVRVVPRYSRHNGSSNRLRLLLMEEFQDYDHAAMLDCDTLIVQCPCRHFEGAGIAVKPADQPTLAHEQLLGLYARFALDVPARRVVATHAEQSMLPYFNAGVASFDRTTLLEFAPLWQRYTDALIADGDWRHHTHVSQAAFAMAMASELERYRELPPEWNFPTHFAAGEVPEHLRDRDPVVVHYHAEVDASGVVKECGLPATDVRIRAFNERHSAERRRGRHRSRFWHVQIADARSLDQFPGSEPPAPFIVGLARSGTTLLRLMLDSHTQMAIPLETFFIREVAELPSDDEGARSVFHRRLIEHPRWPDMRVDAGDFADALRAAPPFSVAEGLRCFYRLYAARFGKLRWGDKTPGYAEEASRIARLLPEAHFIHVIRDGRGVALASRHTWWQSHADMTELATLWCDRITTLRQQADAGLAYLEVRYEDVVSHPAAVLRRLCGFLALPYESGMLRYHERAAERMSELTAPGSSPHASASREERLSVHERSFEPPDPALITRWREELSEEQIRAYNRVAAPLLSELGYPM